MAFFTIHGWELSIADGSWGLTPDFVGKIRRRGINGTMRSSRRARKGTWRAKTIILDPTEAAPAYELLSSNHDVWSFDEDQFSSKGRGWSTTPALDATNKKFGASSMTAASAATYTTTWDESTTRTVLLWRRNVTGAFVHYALVLTSTTLTTQYQSGIAGSFSAGNWITAVADGTFSLLGKDNAGANGIVQYDDVVVLPFAITQAMATAWAAQTRAWADAPGLNCSGTGFSPHAGSGSPNVVVNPDVAGMEFVQGRSEVTGSFADNLQSLEFEVAEV